MSTPEETKATLDGISAEIRRLEAVLQGLAGEKPDKAEVVAQLKEARDRAAAHLREMVAGAAYRLAAAAADGRLDLSSLDFGTLAEEVAKSSPRRPAGQVYALIGAAQASALFAEMVEVVKGMPAEHFGRGHRWRDQMLDRHRRELDEKVAQHYAIQAEVDVSASMARRKKEQERKAAGEALGALARELMGKQNIPFEEARALAHRERPDLAKALVAK